MRKIIILLVVLLLAGCGQDQESTTGIDLSETDILWSGHVYEDAAIQQKFSETMACLNSLDVYKTGAPLVVLTDSSFYCGSVRASGCYVRSSNTVYAIQLATGEIPSFRHEIVHWATGFGVEWHDSVYFNLCGQRD